MNNIFFRGAVENNYVSFAGRTWRIVRINGDGTIRIVLNEKLGSIQFNSNEKDNTYVGYMYGSPGAITYEKTHENINNSNVKEYLDNWYKDNLSDFSFCIVDSIFCNDRSVSDVKEYYGETGFLNTGIGVDETIYSGYKRVHVDFKPSLKCPQYNDRFTTIESSFGNGELKYPIGLLTIDEFLMAGAGTINASTNDYYYNESSTGAFYLYEDGGVELTMTPEMFYAGDAYINELNAKKVVQSSTPLTTASPVRPVVSLNAEFITDGTGISYDPFVVS